MSTELAAKKNVDMERARENRKTTDLFAYPAPSARPPPTFQPETYQYDEGDNVLNKNLSIRRIAPTRQPLYTAMAMGTRLAAEYFRNGRNEQNSRRPDLHIGHLQEHRVALRRINFYMLILPRRYGTRLKKVRYRTVITVFTFMP